jgi:hypothetical protein
VLNAFAVGTAARKSAGHRSDLASGAARVGVIDDSGDTAHWTQSAKQRLFHDSFPKFTRAMKAAAGASI